MQLPGAKGGLSWARVIGAFDLAAHRRLKYKEDLTVPSALGACLSLGGILCVVLLVLAETVSYLAVRPRVDVALAPRGGGALPIRFNVTFGAVACELLSLRAADALGEARPITAASEVHFYATNAAGAAARRVRDTAGARIAALAAEDAAAAAAAAAGAPDAGAGAGAGPTALDADAFEPWVRATTLAVVSFGAPWCPWSQRLEPVMRELGAAVGARVPGLAVGTVDCTAPAAGALCASAHVAA